MRFFCAIGGIVCAAGCVGKEEPVWMHGGCEDKGNGQIGVRGSPDTFLAEERIGKSKIKNQNAKIQIKYKKGIQEAVV